MHPSDCQWWEYKDHLNAHLVGTRCIALLTDLRRGRISLTSYKDTRPHHRFIFSATVPIDCDYFAGHYRGEKYRCLEFLKVKIDGDTRVGVDPERVAFDISNFVTNILTSGVSALDTAFALPNSRLSPEEKLNYLVVFCCRVLVEFLRIHPYANGNGHMGRLLVWLLLARYDYWPKRWPLDQSPPYSKLIFDYRNGDTDGLELFVFRCIIG